MLGQSVRYPLGSDDVTYLDQFAQQAAQQGSLLFLTLEPTKPLAELTAADATALTGRLGRCASATTPARSCGSPPR